MSPTRFTVKLFVMTLAIVVACESVSLAQRGGRRRGRRETNAISLAALQQVQGELNVTEEQRAQIQELFDDYRGQSQELFAGLQDLSREERAEKMVELRGERGKLAAESRKKLAGLLKEDQLKRLHQIVIQALGGRSLARDDVAKALGLTDEQREQIKAIVDSEQDRRRTLIEKVQSGAIERSEIRAEFATMRNEISDAALGLLSDDQKESLTKLQGEKFELQQQPGGRNS